MRDACSGPKRVQKAVHHSIAHAMRSYDNSLAEMSCYLAPVGQ